MLAFPSAAELNLSKQSASVFDFRRTHVKVENLCLCVFVFEYKCDFTCGKW